MIFSMIRQDRPKELDEKHYRVSKSLSKLLRHFLPQLKGIILKLERMKDGWGKYSKKSIVAHVICG